MRKRYFDTFFCEQDIKLSEQLIYLVRKTLSDSLISRLLFIAKSNQGVWLSCANKILSCADKIISCAIKNIIFCRQDNKLSKQDIILCGKDSILCEQDNYLVRTT